MPKQIETMHEDAYRKARKRVKAKKGFYSHLVTYIATGFFLFGVNMFTSPWDTWWPIPMMGWGIGLVIHYFSVFGLPGTDILTKEWEDREMEKELHRQGYDPELDYEEEGPEEDELELREIQKERREGGLEEDGFV